MIHLLNLSYHSATTDRRVTREEAQEWMKEAKDLGPSWSNEMEMWRSLDQHRDLFEPGVVEEVESFLKSQAASRPEPGLFTRGVESVFKTDSDFDGLSNKDERRLNTNPFRADTDGDGFDDAEEVRRRTDPGKFLGK